MNITNSNGMPVSANLKKHLIVKFSSWDAHVAVIGLGYVGLPLAVAFAEAGYWVTGIDVDLKKVDAINLGNSYIDDISCARILPLVESGHLGASDDYSMLHTCDAVSICVPTPLRKTGDPDISYIVAAADEIASYQHPGMVIVLESITYPGTTTEIILPRLNANGNGWAVGKEFFLAFSPERVDPGRTDWTVNNTPKVMGGVTDDCCAVAMAYLLCCYHRRDCASLFLRGRRDDQAIGKYVSRRQYRHGQRNVAHLRQAEIGCLGGYRCCRY